MKYTKLQVAFALQALTITQWSAAQAHQQPITPITKTEAMVLVADSNTINPVYFPNPNNNTSADADAKQPDCTGQGSTDAQLCAFKYYRAGDYQAAVTSYTQAIVFDTKNPLLFNNRGVAKEKMGDYVGAISDYSQAISLDGGYANAYLNRAIAKRHLGRAYQDDLTRALRLNPQLQADAANMEKMDIIGENGYGQNVRSQRYANTGKTNVDSTSSQQCSVLTNPFECGMKRYLAGDYQAAVDAYSQAIEAEPRNPLLYNNRGVAYEKIGNFDAAYADYTQATTLNANYAEAFQNRALLKQRMRPTTTGIDNDDDSMQTANTYGLSGDAESVQCGSDNWVQCGVSRYRAGDYKGALSSFNQEIFNNPDNAVAYNNRGVTKEKMLNFNGAIEDYNKALTIRPNYMEARSNLEAANRYVIEIKQMKQPDN